jgi:hypothetical protein|tara:strand:+ start:156 stop:602 length:447 start_codon:yes stop_codon:yes gene_type:complete
MVNPDAIEAKYIKKSVGKLKKVLWDDFTLWVKLSRSPDGIYVPCYTCDAPLEIGTSNCQGGHWIAKSVDSFHYFDERMVRPQCYRCNIHLSGNSEEFRLRLIDELGQDVVDEMSNERKSVAKRNRGWYVDKIIHYRVLLEEMDSVSLT